METTAPERALKYILGIPLAIAAGIWVTWVTVTAFVGGQAPLFFIHFDGVNVIRGAAWTVFVDPLVATLAYWAFMMVMMPIFLLVSVGARIGRRSAGKPGL